MRRRPSVCIRCVQGESFAGVWTGGITVVRVLRTATVCIRTVAEEPFCVRLGHACQSIALQGCAIELLCKLRQRCRDCARMHTHRRATSHG